MKHPLIFGGGSWSYGVLWFRLWNEWGLSFKHRSSLPLFSERYGYTKCWPKWPARWRVSVLAPNRIEDKAMAQAYANEPVKPRLRLISNNSKSSQ